VPHSKWLAHEEVLRRPRLCRTPGRVTFTRAIFPDLLYHGRNALLQEFQTSDMTPSWDSLSGVSIDGKYVVERWLGGGDADAVFETRLGPEGHRAALKLVREEPDGAGRQLAGWRRAARLSHPNVLGLYDCGRAGMVGKSADTSYLYVVFEYPDDSLEPALEQGGLSEAETLDVLRASLAGLRYIHAQGLVHGALDAAHIVAVGDRIKLASDTLGEPSDAASPAEDVRALGSLLQAMLGMPEPTSVSEPLRSVIVHATDPNPNERWTLDKIAALLNPPRRAPASPEPMADKPRRVWQLSPFRLWAYGAVAVPLLVIGFWVVHKSGTPHQAPGPAARPAAVRPKPAEAVPHAGARRAHADPDRVWRVVAYTYSGYKPAEKKARHINGRWPGFHAEVFTPRGSGRPPYLVALGGRMTRGEAAALQRSARAHGLPRDVFIRNYPE
jgi:eukaryotic-like serine/threonine-protein kinase